MKSPPPSLGPTEPSRLALCIGKIPFNDDVMEFPTWKAIKAGEKPNPSYWGQLPYMTIGEGDSAVQVGQSDAILRYCGKLAGLQPEDPMEALKVDEMVQFLNQDVRDRGLARSMSIKDDEEKMAQRKKLNDELLPAQFEKISARMDSSGFLCNGKLSIADLILYTTCSWIGMGTLDGITADFIKANEKIAAHYKKIGDIPEVAEWNAKKRVGKVPAF